MREADTARRDMASAIEAVREGFALFGADDVLKLFNRRFCWLLPDVRQSLEQGQKFESYIERVSRSRHLRLSPGMKPEDWARDRIQRHLEDRVSFNLALKGDRWLQISEHRTETGGTAIVQTDVTDLVSAERMEREKLLDSQARMIRATLDHLDQGVAIFDAQARLVGWNERLRQLTGMPSTVWKLGMSFARIAEHLRQDFSMRGVEDERRLGQWVSRQMRGQSLSFEISRAEDLVLSVFMQRLPDEGFVLSFSDVTREREATRVLAQAKETLEERVRERTLELQDALQAAKRSNASRTRFVAAVSHDLLQPLSAAKLYLASVGSEDAQVPAVAKAEDALASVEEMISALLDMSRLESGEEQLTPVPVRISDIILPVINSFRPFAAAKGLQLRIVGSSAVVLSDVSYLRRIVQNLLSNAIRYTSAGKILVGVRRVGGGVRLEVHDTGPGIPAEYQGAIFEEFRRLDRRASAAEGMGLGLAIVERACTRLGHHLDLVSEVGRGSVFRVGLDLAEPSDVGLPEVSAPRLHAGPVAATATIVMLVDDDSGLRAALETLLESWGVAVIEASGTAEALSLLDEVGIVPDAFLLDQQLQNGETGLALARALRARYGNIRLRIMSADRRPQLRQACAAAGVELLPKPLDPERLRAFVAEAAAAGIVAD